VEAAVAHGATYRPIPARPRPRVTLDAGAIVPQVTWGTSPQDVADHRHRPDPASM
jgi:hypothetical protein